MAKLGGKHSPRHLRQPKVALARALSKLGCCSRTQAQVFIEAGRVQVNHVRVCNPEQWVNLAKDWIEVDQQRVEATPKVYLMLNKPRGLVTTTADEQGRQTVYTCLTEAQLPWVTPVGRLDKASEGLLLFTNDTRWAARILAPETHLDKTYHVQINRLADPELLQHLLAGVTTVEGDFLAVKAVRLLRHGQRHSWVEVVLDEGKNRQIRRLLAALDIEVLRLIRVAIGPLTLGTLAKGAFRHLQKVEREQLLRGGTALVT